MSFILDASTALAWAFADESFAAAQPALQQVQSSFAIAPVLLHFGIASALRKANREERLSSTEIAWYLADLNTLDIRLQAQLPTLSHLLALSQRVKLSTYDTAYLDLALTSSLPLATLDQDLSRAAKRAGISLVLSI